MTEINPLDRFDTTYLDPADADAVNALEGLGWFVSLTAPGNPRANVPNVYGAEQVGSLPIRRHQAHSLPSLLKAVRADMARRGEDKPVGIVSGVVGAPASPNSEGAAS